MSTSFDINRKRADRIYDLKMGRTDTYRVLELRQEGVIAATTAVYFFGEFCFELPGHEWKRQTLRAIVLVYLDGLRAGRAQGREAQRRDLLVALGAQPRGEMY